MFRKVYLLVVSGLIMFGCSLNEPTLPVWDTSWKIYLPIKNVTMEEIVNDSTLIADTTKSGQPIIKFELKDSTDWERVAQEDLTIQPEEQSFDSKIGSIKLKEKSEVKSTEITLSELLPPEVLAFDTIPPYPDRTVTPDPKEVTYDFFRRAVIKSGQIYLTFHNDLFVKVNAGMTIDVYNNGSDTPVLIARIVFDKPIEPYAVTQSNVVDLSGKEISNKFLLKYTIPIAGSDTSQIVTAEQKNGTIYSVLTIENIEVSEADAEIPEQTFTRSHFIVLPEQDHKVINAKISQGSITLNIKNQLPIHSNLHIELPDLVKNGNPKVLDIAVNPNQQIVEIIDLKGYELLNSSSPGETLDSIKIDLKATVGSNGEIVTITENDQISTTVNSSKIFLESVTGILARIDQPIDPQVLDNEDLFKDIEGTGLNLEDLQLVLVFENQIDVPLNVNLNIEATHEDGGATETKSMQISATIERSSVSPTTKIVLDKNYKNPNSIVDLIAILPTKLVISGNAYIEGYGSVAVGQGLRTKYSVESPLSFKLTNPISYKSGIDSIKKEDIDQETRDRLSDDFQNGSFHLLIKNGTPLAADLILVLAADSNQVFTEAIQDSSKKIVIKAELKRGSVGADGYVTAPTPSEVVIKLSEKQTQLFKLSPIYLHQTVTLLPTGDQKVIVRTSDTIELEGYVQLDFTVRLD
ncbi:MAG: hypothetical protein GXO77_06800 [Calditrichaeota bacterium]|nr:hypothetical protein [Calditrichota bacterium]